MILDIKCEDKKMKGKRLRIKIKCEDKDERWERFDAVTLQAEIWKVSGF